MSIGKRFRVKKAGRRSPGEKARVKKPGWRKPGEKSQVKKAARSSPGKEPGEFAVYYSQRINMQCINSLCIKRKQCNIIV